MFSQCLQVNLIFWVCIAFSYVSKSSCLILHCDPNTEVETEKVFKNHPGMRKYLQEDVTYTSGRIGTIHFVNWQDKLLQLHSPGNKPCVWKMRSKLKTEQNKFNEKGYIGEELNADPVSTKNYYRLISCERDDCIQYFNVFTRPMTNPDFPVQVYTGHDTDVKCNLDVMDDSKTSTNEIVNHMPPYVFEWTGPKDCPSENWHSTLNKKCVRYRPPTVPATCDRAHGCTFSIAKMDYPTAGSNVSEFPADYGYKGTRITITGKQLNYIESPGKQAKPVHTQTESTLKIKGASNMHYGKWRCIVTDNLGISSYPDEKGLEFMKRQEIVHKGIVYIRVKNMAWTFGLPALISVIIIIWVILCIMCCKQCTDYSERVEEDAAIIQIPSKISQKSAVEDTRSISRISQKAFASDHEHPSSVESGVLSRIHSDKEEKVEVARPSPGSPSKRSKTKIPK